MAPALARYNRGRIRLRDGLREHQPFLLVASLSFVIASFLRGSTAAGLAALASIFFLAAVTFSIAQDLGGTPNFVLIVLFYASTSSGFILLFFVGLVIVAAVPGASLGLILASSVLVVTAGVIAILGALQR